MGYIYTNINRIWEGFLTAIGSHLTLSLGGIFFFGFPVIFWTAAYGYAIAGRAGIEAFPAVLLAMVLALGVGCLFAFFYARLSNDSFAVITLASVLAMEALLNSWDSLTGGVLGISGVSRFPGFSTLSRLAMLQGTAALFGLGLESLLAHSGFGRSLRGLKENPDTLISLGTSPGLIGQSAILFASVFAGAAGIFTVMRIQFLDPGLGGFVLLLQVLTIAILANTPKTVRLFLATLAIVLLPEVLRLLDLPTATLGYSRTLLYSLTLIFLVYYVAYNSQLKRNV